MSGPDWLYGPWSPLAPACSAPNMAFQLLTDVSGSTLDCNGNRIPDECDIAGGHSQDVNGNGIPDECEGLTIFSDGFEAGDTSAWSVTVP